MHILLVSHNYPTPLDQGFGFFCRNQAEALVTEGHRVGVIGPLVISWKAIIRARKLYFGYKKFVQNGVLAYLWIGFSIPRVQMIRYAIIRYIGHRMVDRYVQQYGIPDVLHLHVYVATEVAIYASQKYGIPLIWTEHFSDVARNNISGMERKLIQTLIATSQIRIAVSPFLANKLNENFNASFRVLPNVYDSNIFKSNHALDKYDQFTFLSVAYMHPIKNHLRLLDAFELISDIPAVLVLVGIGDMYDRLKKEVSDRALSSKVRFLGELIPEKVAVEMNRSHALVVSSDFETFNVTVVEALACGIPVISTKCGGPEHIILSDEIGVLTSKTPESLARGMRFVYDNFGKYSPEIISGYSLLNYSIGAIAKKLTDIYVECA